MYNNSFAVFHFVLSLLRIVPRLIFVIHPVVENPGNSLFIPGNF